MRDEGVLASDGGPAMRLGDVLRRAPFLMDALRGARAVAAPEWLVTAGAIRDAVWDDLHGRAPTAPPRDVDLAFFDPADLTPERDAAVEEALHRRAPGVGWEAKNQAAVHCWYPRVFGLEVPPFHSCAEAVATFPETASAVGVRLLDHDDLLVVAPFGLDDLFGCVCRHNPARVPPDRYERRVVEKRFRERWPRMRYVAPGHGTVGGGSDGNFTGALGIPTLDGLGVCGDGFHTDTEHLALDSVVPRARLLSALLRTLR